MSLVSYVLKTDWKTKQADWREYNLLCDALHNARRDMWKVRESVSQQIRVICEEPVVKPTKYACIRRYVRYEEPVVNLGEATPSRQLNAQIWEEKCPKYGTAACGNQSCVYNANNAKYCAVRNAYVELLKKKQNFWDAKFANVK